MLIEEWMKKTKQERQMHLDLQEPCLERGGTWTQFRGVLVQYLDTTFPSGRKIHMCHACNNEKCSNPKHLYWGTPTENAYDAILSGARKSRKGIPGSKHSDETKRKLSLLFKGKRSNNPNGINGSQILGTGVYKSYKRKYKQKWINDGLVSTRIKSDQLIPDGWVAGRI